MYAKGVYGYAPFTLHSPIERHTVLTITGSRRGVPYDVTVNQGVVTGSEEIATLLRVHGGESFAPYPTSGTLILDLEDEQSVLAALTNLTRVTEVGGDVVEPEPVVAGVDR
jgi:hypothetical protein